MHRIILPTHTSRPGATGMRSAYSKKSAQPTMRVQGKARRPRTPRLQGFLHGTLWNENSGLRHASSQTTSYRILSTRLKTYFARTVGCAHSGQLQAARGSLDQLLKLQSTA